MPFPLLLALIIAFGIDTGRGFTPLSPIELERRVGQTAGALALLAALAFVVGQVLAWRLRRWGPDAPSGGRALRGATLALDGLGLVTYAWIIHGVGWPAVVLEGFDLRDALLIDEGLILLPYLIAQVAVWVGLYRAERARRLSVPEGDRSGLGRQVLRKTRQAMGAVLPVALVYGLGRDLIVWQWPEAARNPWVEVGGMVVMATSVLVLAPALVRLTWPARPLPPGPLRDRLERLARRFGFRCTDILVWDTGGAIANAGVTGALPWFRYVLLSDALLQQLDEREVEAVFGHEVGHIVHRHLAYFGLFLLGSIGVMALLGLGIESAIDALLPRLSLDQRPALEAVLKSVAVLACLGLYFLLLFGHLSRRFERQADIFGCRVVSCDRADCPPHADLNASTALLAPPLALCPVGIRTFANALSKVAASNGIDEGRLSILLSWRHGRVARRIAFLDSLEGQPEAERRFQAGIARLRLGLAVVLALAVAAALATGALDQGL
ncbi:MAG: M48 family metalloprotease [Isosphaeraceae bacterium]|nr:M48 family metalloprotease [Isosphaeraceae bacterium]